MPEPNTTTTRPSRDNSGGWALEIAQPFGIPIRIHFTFALLLLWAGWSAWKAGSSPLRALLFLILLFSCVALHELGHALMARRFGVTTRQIVLYPIGGIATLDRIPSGKAELLIALAGPAVNVVIGAGLIAAMIGLDLPWPARSEDAFGTGGLVSQLLLANLSLVFFNMIPAFPMDGGRVLRATLSFFLPPVQATTIAARIGQAVAILFGAFGLYRGNFALTFIAFFVFMGAGQEAAFEKSRGLVGGRTARAAMIRRFDVLQPQDSLGRAADLLLDSHQQDFPVVDGWNRVAGVLPRSLLLDGLARRGRDGAVLEVMRREVKTIDAELPLGEALLLLQADPGAPLLVLEGGVLTGMITLENLSELLAITERLRRPVS